MPPLGAPLVSDSQLRELLLNDLDDVRDANARLPLRPEIPGISRFALASEKACSELQARRERRPE
jgi:hypothetical protein